MKNRPPQRTQSATSSHKPSPLPRWLLILGALVPVAALAWTIFKDLWLKPEPKPPAAGSQAATSTQSQTVTASGPGSVAVGNMTGGSITVKPDGVSGQEKASQRGQ